MMMISTFPSIYYASFYVYHVNAASALCECLDWTEDVSIISAIEK